MSSPFLWRPLDSGNIADPYPMYARLRRQDPVHLAQTKEYIVTRYADVRHVLKSPSFETGNRLTWIRRGVEYFDNKEQDLRAIYQAMNAFVLMMNGEKHQRVRNFISRAWNDREVDALISRNVSRLLPTIGKHTDFVADFAQPLPVYTISGILGAPVSDCQHLIRLGVAMTKTLDLYISLKDLVSINDAAREFIAFFQEQVRARRERLDESLLSKLIRKNDQEQAGLSEEELVSVAIFLFTAGEETSAGLLTTAMLNLLRHPEQLALLRKRPELAAPAVEEVLRFDSVVHLLGRVSTESVTLGDKEIPSGATLTLVIGSANRDENVFENADHFIITRNPNRHLAFGSGIHFCLGDWLGRRQTQLALTAFLDRFPEIRLTDENLSWYRNIAVRRLNRLMIECGD